MKFLAFILLLFLVLSCEDDITLCSSTNLNGECSEGQVCDSGKCVYKCDPICDNNSFCYEGSCRCNDGFIKDGDSCVEIVDLCKNVTCSNNGKCAIQDDKAICICNDNYHSQDLECLKDGNPCEGVKCSDHGNCTLYNDTAVCLCEEGYHSESLKCLENDPCSFISCSENQHCVSSTDKISCECDNNYIMQNDECIFDCSLKMNSHPNAQNDGCICDDGFENRDGRCIVKKLSDENIIKLCNNLRVCGLNGVDDSNLISSSLTKCINNYNLHITKLRESVEFKKLNKDFLNKLFLKTYSCYSLNSSDFSCSNLAKCEGKELTHEPCSSVNFNERCENGKTVKCENNSILKTDCSFYGDLSCMDKGRSSECVIKNPCINSPYCDGNLVNFCDDGISRVISCPIEMENGDSTCSGVTGRVACSTSQEVCDDGFINNCDGDTTVNCNGGNIDRFNCKELFGNSFSCFEVDSKAVCNVVTPCSSNFSDYCNNNKLTYCNNGVTKEFNCTENGYSSCGELSGKSTCLF